MTKVFELLLKGVAFVDLEAHNRFVEGREYFIDITNVVFYSVGEDGDVVQVEETGLPLIHVE